MTVFSNRMTGDEVLEVNGLKVKGKSVHDICDTLCQMTGTLTFVIVPGPGAQSGATASAAVTGATAAAASSAAAKDPIRDEVPETVVTLVPLHYIFNLQLMFCRQNKASVPV